MEVSCLEGPEKIYEANKDLSALLQEEFHVLLLNTKLEQIGKRRMIFRGTLDFTLCHPREILRPAIVEGAYALIILHNHPSGHPEPSQEDREIARRLVDCGVLIGIPILDFIIVGKQGYFSFGKEEHDRGCSTV